jgi:hypothetical protein
LNPTRFFETVTPQGSIPQVTTQELRHFNVFFSIGQPF